MIKSESIAKIAPALVKAQASMGGAQKSADNPFFKSKYADLSAVMAAISEPLHENGILMTQLPGKAEGAITVTTMLIHESGEYIGCEAALPMTKCPTAHELGSAITYLRRYSAAAITGLTQEDDDGNKATKAQKRKAETVDTAEAEQILTAAAKEGEDGLRDAWATLNGAERAAIAEHKADWWESLKASTKEAA